MLKQLLSGRQTKFPDLVNSLGFLGERDTQVEVLQNPWGKPVSPVLQAMGADASSSRRPSTQRRLFFKPSTWKRMKALLLSPQN